jgi:hypothetical protein
VLRELTPDPTGETWVVDVKFVPVSVRVTLPWFCRIEVGDTDTKVGTAEAMVKLTTPEVAPPEAAFDTVTGTVPVSMKSAAGMVAVREVDET